MISGGLIRLKVRDAVHMDGAVAGSPEQLGEGKVGDIRHFSSSICLNNINKAEPCARPRNACGKN